MIKNLKKVINFLIKNKYIRTPDDIKSVKALKGGHSKAYLLLIEDKHYVIKILPNSWQKRELDIYNYFLPNATFKTSRLLDFSTEDGFIILDYITSEKQRNNESLNRSEIRALSYWIEEKKDFFAKKRFDATPHPEKYIEWMIHDKIDIINGVKDPQIILYSDRILNCRDQLCASLLYPKINSYMPVLEHNDLEQQNIFILKGNVCVIDWANALYLYGIFDIAQLLKYIILCDEIYDKLDFLISLINSLPPIEIIAGHLLIKEINVISFNYLKGGKVWEEKKNDSIKVLEWVFNANLIV